MHALEAATLGKRSSPQDAIERMRAWIIGLGASPDEAADLAGSSKDMAPFLDLAQPDRLIEDGDEPLGPALRLRAVWTPGHTPGHLCFFDESADLLLSGDHVLPRISPNISLLPGGDADPLGDYLTSLERVGKLDAAEVLPAHEYRFAGLPDRTEDLRRHHAARLHEIELVVLARPGVTTWQVAEQLTWSRRWTELGPQRRFALGETLAHLVRLAELGRLERSDTGIDRWWPAGAGADGRPRSAG
jgi:glyoxylase-like metal-dependent hydrolase (beta-lactamase superfamily II)